MKENKACDKDAALRWETLSEGVLLHHPIMDLMEKKERAANGLTGKYISIHTNISRCYTGKATANYSIFRKFQHIIAFIFI